MESKKMNIDVNVVFFSEKDKNGKSVQDLTYAKQGDACVDIRCLEDITINAKSSNIINTGLYVAIPEGWEIQVRPRSGISFKTDLIFKNTIGTIDSGYRDEIRVIMYNLGDTVCSFKAGERIAQMKVARIPTVQFTEVSSLEELQSIGVNRNGGFGSTGLK